MTGLQSAKPRRRVSVDLARRRTIGMDKRKRTQVAILAAAFELLGQEGGRATRVEDVCVGAGISRGTFYNYYSDLAALSQELATKISSGYDEVVQRAFLTLDSATRRTSAAIRYHLKAAVRDRKWGWATVNTSLGDMVFSSGTANYVRTTLGEGMASGEFRLASADAGHDLLLGTCLAATLSLLRRGEPDGYPEEIALHILLGLGVPEAAARAVTLETLPDLVLPSELISFD